MSRAPVKINPVTGKMEKMEGGKGHRDGCLVLSDKYINAAKEAGLGAPGGMFKHIKSLQGAGMGDVPVAEHIGTGAIEESSGRGGRLGAGSGVTVMKGGKMVTLGEDGGIAKPGGAGKSIGGSGKSAFPQGRRGGGGGGAGPKRSKGVFAGKAGKAGAKVKAGSIGAGGAKRGVGAAGAQRKKVGGIGIGSGGGSGGSNIRQVTQGRSRAITTQASEKGSTPGVTFGKFKGVVSTLGGAKDITRGGRVLDESKRIPARGARGGTSGGGGGGGGNIHGFVGMGGQGRSAIRAVDGSGPGGVHRGTGGACVSKNVKGGVASTGGVRRVHKTVGGRVGGAKTAASAGPAARRAAPAGGGKVGAGGKVSSSGGSGAGAGSSREARAAARLAYMEKQKAAKARAAGK